MTAQSYCLLHFLLQCLDYCFRYHCRCRYVLSPLRLPLAVGYYPA